MAPGRIAFGPYGQGTLGQRRILVWHCRWDRVVIEFYKRHCAGGKGISRRPVIQLFSRVWLTNCSANGVQTVATLVRKIQCPEAMSIAQTRM